MERDLFFTDQDNVDCVFHRQLYHNFLCNYVTDIFGEKLDEESNKHFLKIVSDMTTFEDVALITMEFNSFWMYMIMGKLKNGYAEYNKIDYNKNEKIFEYEKIFLTENKIEGFVEEILLNGSFKKSVWL
jgi:hypothetical protein